MNACSPTFCMQFKRQSHATMSNEDNIFQSKQFKCSVSSVLNKDVKQSGKTFMFDGQDDTAWNSDQGFPQHIHITFNEPIQLSTASRLEIKFQGGFVGSIFHLSLDDCSGNNVYKKSFYPDDVNDLQMFQLDPATCLRGVKKMSITFEKSSDFFGRIIIYDLRLFP